MLNKPAVRDLNDEERAALESQLDRFRNEFAVWRDMVRNDWEMLALVRHEKIDLKVVDETEPLVLGEKCVTIYGCRWCMIEAGKQWHVAVTHDSFDEPIDLTHFSKKRVETQLSQRWQRRFFLLPPQR